MVNSDRGIVASLSCPRARSRDRRSGIAALLARVVTNLGGAGEPRRLLSRFEEAVQAVLPVRDARLRLLAPGETPPAAHGSDRMVLELPASPPGRRAVLEVTVPGGRPLDDWQVQLLHTATYVAALTLEVDVLRCLPTTPSLALVRRPHDETLPLVGTSPQMRTLRERIERVAATDFTVLIEGESGSGKELVARQIHEMSRRRRGPFIAVNCAALVESLLEAELFGIEERTATGVRGRRGKFEHADGGTLFLDEVSDLSPTAQAKLLRAIQDLAVERVGGHASRRVDIRVVVATNRSLAGLVQHARFRADLYYRLNGVEVFVPPLRARREDVLELATHFLERHRPLRALRISSVAADALVTYDWPGNVRELERVIERAVALCENEAIGLDDLPPAVSGGYRDVLVTSLDRDDTLRTWAGRYVRLVLDRCKNNKRAACDVLGISYHTLMAHLRQRPRRTSAGEPVVWEPRVAASPEES